MKINLIVSSLMLMFVSTTAFCEGKEGNDKGNGGDVIASEFVDSAKKIAQTMKNYPGSIEGLTTHKQFEDIIKATMVTSQVTVVVDGLERDAINLDGKIIVSRARWINLEDDAKFRIITHEYFSLLGIEDSDTYDGSSMFMNRVIDAKFDLSKHIVRYTNQNGKVLSIKSIVCKVAELDDSYTLGIDLADGKIQSFGLGSFHDTVIVYNSAYYTNGEPKNYVDSSYDVQTGAFSYTVVFRGFPALGASYTAMALKSADSVSWTGQIYFKKLSRKKKNITYNLECSSHI